jgi:hypothetical protein
MAVACLKKDKIKIEVKKDIRTLPKLPACPLVEQTEENR